MSKQVTSSEPFEPKWAENREALPQHVAIIMDGNGRWARERGKPRLWGHKKGVEKVREVTRTAKDLGIKVLTLYAFSEENWGRPEGEVHGLMHLLNTFILRDRESLMRHGVRLRTIGDLERLPQKTRRLVEEACHYLANNKGLILNIALSYGSKAEICKAIRRVAEEVSSDKLSLEAISPQLVESYLETSDLPSPDLLIRTSGEQRLSNFLLWQLAYSELWFTSVHWPDFSSQHFYTAIESYLKRERRFGLVARAEAP